MRSRTPRTTRPTKHPLARARVAAAVAIASAVLAGACGSDGGGGGDGGGRILRYGYDLSAQFTNTFDVQKSRGDCDSIALAPLYDTLVHKKPGNELEPGLAESWKILDPTTIEVTLREGLVYSDGSPLNADALQQALEHNSKNDQLSDLRKIETYTKVDERTLRMKMKQPIAAQMPATFTARDGMPMKPGSTSEQPIGAGPFVLASFQPGAKISLRKNDKYWNDEVYKGLDGIDLTQTGTGPPAVSALLAGDLDLVRMEADSYADVKQRGGYEVVVQSTGAYLQFEFRQNFKDKPTPFANKLVRQAVSHALDRKKINDVVQDALGEVASQPFPKDSPAYVPEVADLYPYDPEKAKALLDRAGYPDGFEFVMAIPGGNIANMERQSTLVQQMLDAIGLKAKVNRILGSDIATQYYILGKGDAFVAAELDSTFPTGKLQNNYGVGQFVAIWDGVERDDITDLMLKAQATTSLDETYRLVREGVKIAMNEALDVPIAFMPQLMAYDKNRVSGTIGGQTNICDPPDLTQAVVKE
jgi:peptide/nickel transport system substrate-binding protein